jgi:hypothetical protein
MVAESLEAKSRATVKELKAQQMVDLASLRTGFSKHSATLANANQIRAQRNAIHANQLRNEHQIQIQNAQASLNRAPTGVRSWIEQEIVRRRKTANSAARIDWDKQREEASRITVPNREDAAVKEQAREIQRQIDELQKRLQLLQKSPVRPAQHLEPIFTNEQPLKPLYPR